MQWREQEEIEKQLQNLRKKHHDVWFMILIFRIH